MNERIRVLVVDDQDLIRRGLTMMLQMEDDIEVVGQARDGEMAVQLAHQHKPNVVLMDIKMPRMNGIQATRAIAQALPETHVVILTTYDTDDMVFEAIRAGAQSYLLKESSEAEVLDVIHMVQQGESRMSPTIAHKILEAFRSFSLPVAQPLAADEPHAGRPEKLGIADAGRCSPKPRWPGCSSR